MFRTPVSRRYALVPLLLLVMTAAACGAGDGGSGPNDDDIFGTYTLQRANGESVPGAKVLEASPGPGLAVNLYAVSGSFRISEDGTWAFSMHFEQISLIDDQVSAQEYDAEDSGTYTLQGETITLNGGTVISLVNGVLSRTIVYDVPFAPLTNVVYEFEK